MTEADLASQQFLCHDEEVVYECRILLPSAQMSWNIMSWNTEDIILEFSARSQIGDTYTASDGKIIATLTGLIVSEDAFVFFNSTLSIEPPLVNNSVVTCKGRTEENMVESSRDILLSGEL